jgi:2,4-dienoyl-CoA reductase-like NADH-dependent reductase (Old Yellow Enzyme family)
MQKPDAVLDSNPRPEAEAHLFSPLKIRQVELRNRIAVSPMCQYSCEDGMATDWHFVHLGSRAVGGAGLVIVEATGVEARGRISPSDMGLWKDEQIAPLARIGSFVRSQGSVAGIQLAHAGRKASTHAPWKGGTFVPESEGGWIPVAPSAIPFRDGDPAPTELSKAEIRVVVAAFAEAAKRALTAGFQLVEIHAAHGYLLHEFLSPLSNTRTDEYGGTLENRMRFALEVAETVRGAWPAALPLFMRISASDWVSGGWSIDDSVELARRLGPIGVDLVDCSSGGLVPYAKIELGPGYQVPFAARVRREGGILTGAVGMITDPHQADGIIRDGRADVILLAREFLRDPYFPLHAARALGVEPAPPVQYKRAF